VPERSDSRALGWRAGRPNEERVRALKIPWVRSPYLRCAGFVLLVSRLTRSRSFARITIWTTLLDRIIALLDRIIAQIESEVLAVVASVPHGQRELKGQLQGKVENSRIKSLMECLSETDPAIPLPEPSS
jgi:hypothetical protein